MTRHVTPEQQEAYVREACRRAGVDQLDVPANSGRRRTADKRALLRELHEDLARQGLKPAFKAKF